MNTLQQMDTFIEPSDQVIIDNKKVDVEQSSPTIIDNKKVDTEDVKTNPENTKSRTGGVINRELSSGSSTPLHIVRKIKPNNIIEEHLINNKVRKNLLPIVKDNDPLHLLSYLEKSKIKEDMRRLLSSKITQIKTLIEMDYFEARSNLRRRIGIDMLGDKEFIEKRQKDLHLDILCCNVQIFDDLLVRIKTCDSEFPDLKSLISTCFDYCVILTKARPSIFYATEEDMKKYQDKVSLCKATGHLCEVYRKNAVWKEYLEGDWESKYNINDVI
jgi:hypothetical protein